MRQEKHRRGVRKTADRRLAPYTAKTRQAKTAKVKTLFRAGMPGAIRFFHRSPPHPFFP